MARGADIAAQQFLDQQTREILVKLKKLDDYYGTKEAKKILIRSARPLIKAAKAKVDKSKKPHHRYLNGKIVATYYPGNLKRSIGILKLKRSPDVFVGPRISKGGSGGKFIGPRVDGYYAHMVEDGTIDTPAKPFLRPAAEVTKSVVQSLIIEGSRKVLKNYNRKYARL